MSDLVNTDTKRSDIGKKLPSHDALPNPLSQHKEEKEKDESCISERHPTGGEPPPKFTRAQQSVLYCGFGFLTILGLRRRIIQNLAFRPPLKGYYITDENNFHISRFNPNLTILDRWPAADYPIQMFFDFIPSRHNAKSVASLVFLNNFSAKYSEKFFLIMSGGNGADIGWGFGYFVTLCCKLNVSVLAYDYSGYGLSRGYPSEKNIYKNIRQAYKFLIQKYKVHPKHIIIYGISIGSGPSCDIAADKRYPIGGLILQSGVASGLRILFPQLKSTPWFDAFPNIDKLKRMQIVPTFLYHGKLDDTVPVEHGYQLKGAAEKRNVTSSTLAAPDKPISKEKFEYFTLNRVSSFWIDNAGHNDVFTIQQQELIKKLRAFLQFCKEWNAIFSI